MKNDLQIAIKYADGSFHIFSNDRSNDLPFQELADANDGESDPAKLAKLVLVRVSVEQELTLNDDILIKQ